MKGLIKTTDELHDFALEIDFLLTCVFKSKNKSLDDLLEKISPKSALILKNVLSKNKLAENNKDLIGKALLAQKNKLNYKIISITLAFEPSETTIGNIYSWVMEKLGTEYILDIDIDKTIMAGAIISFNGSYKDFTVKKNLEEVFADKNVISKLIQ